MKRDRWDETARRVLAAAVLVSSLLHASCVSRWERDVSVGTIHFHKLRQIESGTRIGKTGSLTEHDGIACLPGWTSFREDWSLYSCVLAAPISVGNTEIPNGAWVEFDPVGTVRKVAFAEDTTVQGYRCIGTRGTRMGVHTEFYPSGRLRQFSSSGHIRIDGIPCDGGIFSFIELYENGSLRRCRLAETIEIDGTLYRRRRIVERTRNGEIVESIE